MNQLNQRKQINKLRLFDIFCTFFVFFVMILLLLNPKKYTGGTIGGIKLFFYSVLPGLFPFMLLTKILTELGVVVKLCTKLDKFSYKVFGTNGLGCYAFIMSILSGYPIGAKIIGDLFSKNLITESEAKNMSVFCTTSGPIFVIGAVGTIMFGSYKIGLIMYFSHIISSLFLGIIFNFFTSKNKINNTKICILTANSSKNIINLCINDTISSLFIVCAYITIFYLLGEILTGLNVFVFLTKIISPVFKILNIDSNYLLGLFYGLLEVTRGAKTLSIFADEISIIISTGLISFSGISIIFQSMTFLKTAKIKMHKFVFSKLIHSILSMIICFFILKIVF